MAARLVVDNTKGDEPQFAAALDAALRGAGFEVEVREPRPHAAFDTTVHFIVSGVSVRVLGEPTRQDLASIAGAVREAEAHRRGAHRRFRSVPIYVGETSRVHEWVDVVGE
jgi:hypothetical protein